MDTVQTVKYLEVDQNTFIVILHQTQTVVETMKSLLLDHRLSLLVELCLGKIMGCPSMIVNPSEEVM